MLIFSMFDGSGFAALPWAEAGHKVICFNADEGGSWGLPVSARNS